MRKRGPIKHLPAMVDTHIFMPEDLSDWAKEQPGGMASLVRQLLTKARKQARRLEIRRAERRRAEMRRDE